MRATVMTLRPKRVRIASLAKQAVVLCQREGAGVRASARSCWLVIFAVLLTAPVLAAPIRLQDGRGAIYVRHEIQMLADPTRTMTVAQVAASKSFGPFGLMPDSHTAYWLRISYDARASADTWYLFLGFKPSVVELYAPAARGYVMQRSGLMIPYADRPVHAYGVVAFALPRAVETTVYARIITQEPDLTVAIDPSALFWKVNVFNLVAIVALDSVLIALLVNTLALFLMSHNKIYLLYASYLLAEGLYRSSIAGVLAAYVWPHAAIFPPRINIVLDGLRIIALTMMMREFLNLRLHSRIVDRVNLGIVVVAAVYATLAAIGVSFNAATAPEFALIYVPIWIVSAIVAWRRGEERAPLLVLAWGVFMAGSFAFAFKQLIGFGRGDLMTELIVAHGTDIGIALQGLFLSLALSSELQQLSRARDRFERLSVYDALTGIGNRRLFETALQREWGRATRSEKPIALLMVDIDHFKDYNDSYGHAAGDVALCTVARSAESTMRSGDLFCRYGGEEFVAILPDTDDDGAMRAGERIQRAILEAKLPFAVAVSPSGVLTVSVGAASLRPTAVSSSAALFERADHALYRAKEHGRNRIELSTV